MRVAHTDVTALKNAEEDLRWQAAELGEAKEAAESASRAPFARASGRRSSDAQTGCPPCHSEAMDRAFEIRPSTRWPKPANRWSRV